MIKYLIQVAITAPCENSAAFANAYARNDMCHCDVGVAILDFDRIALHIDLEHANLFIKGDQQQVINVVLIKRISSRYVFISNESDLLIKLNFLCVVPKVRRHVLVQ